MASSGSTEERLKAALADRYRIEVEIGSGAMATVYLAEDLKHHRKVAVKVLDPDLAATVGAERFLREIETAANLTHPHILPVHDSGEADGFLFYVMPYVEGESLRSRLTKEKQLPVEDAIQITREVADALAYAHREGVIHRDVKPANILLAEGHAVLADFGVAHAVAEARDDRITRTGTSLGTPAYMSPEQASGGQHLDGRSDQYALGCVLYEMLAGHPPFTGAQVEAVVRQHLTEEPPSVTQARPSVTEEVANVINRALAKSPADRFRTTGEMAAALALTTTPVPAASRRLSTSPGLVAGLLGVTLLGVAAIVVSRRVAEPPADARAAIDSERPSVAVLPLQNLSGREEDAWFTDGMHGQILTQLHKIGSLRVTSSTSVQEYRDTPKNLRTIGRELGARYIAEGDVLRAGAQVRVNIQLIDAQADEHIWANSYDRPLSVETLLTIQTEIAQAIAGALRAALTPEEEEELLRLPTDNQEAYDFYLRGDAHFARRRSGEDANRAVDLYGSAVEEDPNFALAWAGLSMAYSARQWLHGGGPEDARAARDAAETSLRLDPELPETHLALGYVHYYASRDFETALREFEIARERRPNNADVVAAIAYVHRRQGRWEEGIEGLERATELDPRNVTILTNLGNAHLRVRQYDASERYYDLGISVAPDIETPYLGKIQVVLLRGDVERARQELTKFLGRFGPERLWETLNTNETIGSWSRHGFASDLDRIAIDLGRPAAETAAWCYHMVRASGAFQRGADELAHRQLDSALVLAEAMARESPAPPRLSPRLHSHLGLTYAALGREEEAVREGRAAVEILPVSRDARSGPPSRVHLANIFVLVGRYEEAIDELDYLLSIPSAVSVPLLRTDPLYDPLRDHPRFQALLEKYAGEVEH